MRQFLLLFLTLWSGFSTAVVVTDLYQIEVPVVDQSAASRDEGMQLALQQVLVKVSGQVSVLENEKIQQAVVAGADRYVKSFRYGRDEVDDSMRLKVIFAANLIDRLLKKSEEPIWGKSRPLILAWQAVEEDQLRQSLNQASGVWPKLVERAMNERGLPVLWPALDLEDEVVLPLEKLWGLFKQDIQLASSRYQADAILAGRLSPDVETGWQYQGILFHQQQNLAIQARAEDVDVILNQVADQVAAFLAKKYAVKTSVGYQPQGYQLEVAGINSFSDYHALLTYLNSKVAITDVHLLRVDGRRLTLVLDLAADWEKVWSVLVLDKKLQISDSEGGTVLEWGQ